MTNALYVILYLVRFFYQPFSSFFHFWLIVVVVLMRTFLSDFLLIGISAIPAGVSSSEANKLANLYIRECENRKTVEEVAALQYSIVLDFCNLCATAIIPFDGNEELLDCIGYIRTHVNTPVSVADVAHIIHRSESYTMKLFHDELGITISHFVNRCKLEEAKSLLSHTEMTLSEISNYLCFSSQSYFQNLFKKKYGVTPNTYRKKFLHVLI